MKIFISWSGERSQALGKALRDWLPLVLHYAEPWLSESDIAAGDRWAQSIATELEASNFGIICVTPENLESPWVLFESGALAKSMQDAKVIPLLFNLEYSDVAGPLAQFQAKKADKVGVSEVVHAINKVSEEKTPEDRSKQLFTALWPELEKALSGIPAKPASIKHTRPHHEILEELVAGVRGLDSRMRDLDALERPTQSRRGFRRLHARLLEDIFASTMNRDEPLFLLVLSGVLRDEMPWVSEVLTESYRELRSGRKKDVDSAIRKIRGITELVRSPISEELAQGSKEYYSFLREMPYMIDHFLHLFLDRHSHVDSDLDRVGKEEK